MKHPKPKYRVGQKIVGRTSNNSAFPNENVFIEIDSARYETKYGHWIYCGSVWHLDNESTQVEIYEYEVEYKFREK